MPGAASNEVDSGVDEMLERGVGGTGVRRPRRVVGYVAVLIVALGGCERSQDSVADGVVATRVDSTGAYPVVGNAGEAPSWTIALIGSVGSVGLSGEPASDEFGRVSSVTPGPDGTVWVADQMNDRIKVFRPDGSLQLEVGGEGQGPGEYSAIYSIAWLGSRLLVLDLGNGRIAELSESGEWLGTRRAPGRISGSPSMLRFYPVSDTSVVQWSLETVEGEALRVWAQHGLEGVVRTWPQLVWDPPEETTVVCDRPDGVISFFSIPFSGQVLRHPARSGASYGAWSADYRFALLGLGGDTIRVVERDWPSIPVTDEAWAEGTAEFSEFREEWPGADCTPRGMSRPTRQAALQNLLVDTDGRVWVEAVGPGGSLWEIFSTEGRLIGSVPGFSYDDRVAPAIRGDRIAWANTDSLGVQRVHWGRIAVPSSF